MTRKFQPLELLHRTLEPNIESTPAPAATLSSLMVSPPAMAIDAVPEE